MHKGRRKGGNSILIRLPRLPLIIKKYHIRFGILLEQKRACVFVPSCGSRT